MKVHFTCRGSHQYVFDSVQSFGRNILLYTGVFLAYQTKKYFPKDEKYHKSAVMKLITMLAILPSTLCEVIVIILEVNSTQVDLLVMALREWLWLYPITFFLFAPKVSLCMHMYVYICINMYECVYLLFLFCF